MQSWIEMLSRGLMLLLKLCIADCPGIRSRLPWNVTVGLTLRRWRVVRRWVAMAYNMGRWSMLNTTLLGLHSNVGCWLTISCELTVYTRM